MFRILLFQRFHALQRILYVHCLILVHAQRVVGQHVQCLHAFQLRHKAAKRGEGFLVIRPAGHHHMADPELFVLFCGILRKGKDVLIVLPGQRLMAFGAASVTFALMPSTVARRETTEARSASSSP